MGECFLVQNGGGVSLNFKVVGNPQPANPKENTIWVNTDVKIPNWYFSATQPENMAEGEVWFPTGTESAIAFNALKKGAVMVYPLFAKQYVGGTLVDVVAEIYQGSKWEALQSDLVLYDNSKGGWQVPAFVARALQPNSGNPTTEVPTVTKNEDGTTRIELNNTNGSGVYCDNVDRDLTGYSQLYFEGFIRSNATNANIGLCIWSNLGTYWLDNITARTNTVEVSSTLNISNLKGSHRIGFGLYEKSYIVLYKLILRR